MLLKDSLGLEINYEEWDKVKRLPFFLRTAYEIQYSIIETSPCVLLFPQEALSNISVLKKHILQIQKIEQIPVVLVLEGISEFRRITFLENKLPFIVDGKMFYLPFIGTYMVHGSDQGGMPIETYRPSSQIAFFYYLYAKKKELPLIELSEKLPFSTMSVNRAEKQLVESKLFQRYKDGVRIILQGNDDWQKLFERAKDFLKSPVRFIGYMDCRLITQDFMLAGVSALAEYTMLNPEPVKTYAIKSGEINRNDLQRELIDESKQVRVELWQYDPKILGKDGIVDPLSLAISLQENREERVEQAVDEMLMKVWEDKNGRWI